MFNFNPRSPRGERRNTITNNVIRLLISIHALREESDLWNIGTLAVCVTAISIHALREESDANESTIISSRSNFNPRSPWGERHFAIIRCGLGSISIHALREESDNYDTTYNKKQGDFNPRSPWGERLVFAYMIRVVIVNFNPRSPWGERPNSTLCDII